jgi:3'-phosphoadenosine 5'-phosphosulfate sulfotransferase (PAPS reductase)/FAD synthetase
MRRVVVGHSGGVTSAWCLGWALRTFPRDEVVALFHNTFAEDVDTYRFLHEIAAKLNIPITERSDGRSVEEVEDDEGAIANNRMAFCSRILKAEQRDRYFDELRTAGVTEIINVLGFSAMETQRVQRASARAERDGFAVRFPVIEEGITKQQCADWCVSIGVQPPRMYEWSDHANCVGCRRGGKGYWLAVAANAPEAFGRAAQREEAMGHTIIKDTTLRALLRDGMKRPSKRREAIDIGACECGS